MPDKTRQTANLVSDNNIYVDIVNDRVGIGSLSPNVKLDVVGNANFTGIVTASSFSGSGVNITGIVTATSFVGSGASLTGITAKSLGLSLVFGY